MSTSIEECKEEVNHWEQEAKRYLKLAASLDLCDFELDEAKECKHNAMFWKKKVLAQAPRA